MFLKSNIEIVGVDYKELSLYLALNRSQSELEEIDLSSYCPKRKANRGRKPTITASGTKRKKEERYAPWIFPERVPNETTKRIMLVEVLKIGLNIVLTNHLYTYDNVVRKQNEGGAIGLQLTGVVADIFMGWWDQKLVSKLAPLNIVCKMYERYVDDINSVLKGNVKGKEYVDGKLIDNEEKRREDETKEKDQIMMELLKNIGNSIHQSIKLEIDYPSQYPDKKLPILDIKVWIDKRESDDRRIVFYEYYEKERNSKWVLHAKAALSQEMKRTILTQQILRIFLNCSCDLTWEHRVKHANEMMKKLQFSGYNKKFRYQVVDSAIKAYRKIVEDDCNGEKPMYRPKGYQAEERKEAKRRKKKGMVKEVMKALFLLLQHHPQF